MASKVVRATATSTTTNAVDALTQTAGIIRENSFIGQNTETHENVFVLDANDGKGRGSQKLSLDEAPEVFAALRELYDTADDASGENLSSVAMVRRTFSIVEKDGVSYVSFRANDVKGSKPTVIPRSIFLPALDIIEQVFTAELIAIENAKAAAFAVENSRLQRAADAAAAAGARK